MTCDIATVAIQGFSNGQNYDTHRPSYPSDAVGSLLRHLRLLPSKEDSTPAAASKKKVIELAAGTGKFTEALIQQSQLLEIVATEPLDGMRQQLENKKLPGVTVKPGVATSIEAEDNQADACIAAQAFHWFAHVDTLREIHRVLAPGGTFAVIWNIEDYQKPPSWPAGNELGQELSELILSLEPDGNTRFRDQKWKVCFIEQASLPTPLFSSPLHEETSSWVLKIEPSALLSRIETLSQVVALSSAQREEFNGRFWGAIDKAEKTANGEVTLHGKTYYAWVKKI